MTRTKRPRPAVMTPAELRAIIEASGLTQGEFAERLGVTRTTVCRWLSKWTPISRPNAEMIRREFAK